MEPTIDYGLAFRKFLVWAASGIGGMILVSVATQLIGKGAEILANRKADERRANEEPRQPQPEAPGLISEDD